MRTRIPVAALLAAVLGAGVAAADGPAAPSTPAQRAFRDLASPFEGERARAVADLQAAMPGARDEVIQAFRRVSPDVRLLLVGVLAREGSPPSLETLLDAAFGDEPTLAARAARALARDPEKGRAALAARRAKRVPIGAAAGVARALDALFLRAEVERLFLAKRSASGYTGYYEGQYAELVVPAYRRAALDMCFHLLADRSMGLPGTHRVGPFEFLNAPSESVEFGEVASMASYALEVLLRPDEDRDVLFALGRLLRERELARREAEALALGDRGALLTRNAYLEKIDDYLNVLLPLARIDPEAHESDVEEILEVLKRGWPFPTREAFASVLLRLKRYREGIFVYSELLRNALEGREVSLTNLHYNLACAYCSWSLSEREAAAAPLRKEALNHLTLAVRRYRWSDLGWMQQDRDLDPIRDTAQYRDLVAYIKANVAPPPRPAPGGPPAPASPPEKPR